MAHRSCSRIERRMPADIRRHDTKTWISKTTGLMLRQDIDVDVGGSLGTSHRSSRYEYGNVRPPV